MRLLWSNEKIVWKWYVFPALFLVLMVGIGPLFYSLFISLHQFNLAKAQIPYRFVGLRNYKHIFTDRHVWNSFKLTMIFSISSVSLELIFGSIMAFLLIDVVRGRNIFRSLFLIPMVITPIAVGLMGRYIFDDAVGIVNWTFRLLKLPRIIWYGNPKSALVTMIILDVWEWSSFVFIIVLAGLMGIPSEFYEAAKVEGAGFFAMVFRVTLPTLRNVYLLALLIRIIDTFKEFDKVYIMTKGGPNFATDFITIRNYTIAFKEFNIGVGSALSIMILIVMIILGTILIRVIQTTD
ncbi:MAG: carbohydrate ABC transporter permease [Thermodesulfovibrionales bacterium]